MTRRYEGMFIIKPDMNEEELNKTVGSIEGTIVKNGGKVENSQKWARRQLAYGIKKYKEGEYYLFDFEAEPKSILAMEDVYRLNENILRTLITAKEK
ncbi:30S ribosomal protein S6 [Omnitrophica bacterium]|nr:30S ribosomal protein S6 [Candidatus Omnitrophota bacterium]